MIEFRGAAKRIEDIDLPRVAQLIGVGEDEIHAILDVESSGSGFDAKGRPKMLFEPHVFYRCLTPDKRAQAVAQGLAYAEWRPGTYPADSYPRLTAACLIDETAALKAASWGLGQILGENHKAAGYPTPQAMVRDFVADEDKHLEAMIRFIKAKGLDRALRNHDWAVFARGYNGASYAAHGYHLKLAAAYARWQKIKDTPFAPGAAPPPPDIAKPVNPPAPAPIPPPPVATDAAKKVGIGAMIFAALGTAAAFAKDHPVEVGCTIVIAIAAFFIIRHWRRS